MKEKFTTIKISTFSRDKLQAKKKELRLDSIDAVLEKLIEHLDKVKG